MPMLAPSPKFRAVGTDGLALVGGKLYTYTAGTSTPKDSYTDFGAGTANTNPVILDARGEADVWLQGSYKLVLKDSLDQTVLTVDDIKDLTSDQTFTNVTLAGTLSITGGTITWAANNTHSGNHTFSANVAFNGTTTIGNASSDAFTVNSDTVTWTNGATHSGNHTWSGTQTFNDDATFNDPVTFSDTALFSAISTFSASILGQNATFAQDLFVNGSSSKIGYGTGSGGTVTQSTSKSTGVSLSKATGSIVTHNAALAAGAVVTFTLTNGLLASGSGNSVYAHVHSGEATPGSYLITTSGATGGSVSIHIRNLTAGSLSEAITIFFKVIMGSVS